MPQGRRLCSFPQHWHQPSLLRRRTFWPLFRCLPQVGRRTTRGQLSCCRGYSPGTHQTRHRELLSSGVPSQYPPGTGLDPQLLVGRFSAAVPCFAKGRDFLGATRTCWHREIRRVDITLQGLPDVLEDVPPTILRTVLQRLLHGLVYVHLNVVHGMIWVSPSVA